MRSFAGRDILSLKDFERQEFFRVFDVAEQMEPIARNRRNVDLLKEKTLVTAFYQPSTRTRLAHEAAMHRLGGHVTGFSDCQDDPRRRLVPGVDQGHRQDAGVLRRRDRDAPLPEGRAAGGRQVVLRADHQRRRRLGRASDPDPDRPVHRAAREGPHRRPEVGGGRRHAHAHDALAGLRADASSTARSPSSARPRMRSSPARPTCGCPRSTRRTSTSTR